DRAALGHGDEHPVEGVERRVAEAGPWVDGDGATAGSRVEDVRGVQVAVDERDRTAGGEFECPLTALLEDFGTHVLGGRRLAATAFGEGEDAIDALGQPPGLTE